MPRRTIKTIAAVCLAAYLIALYQVTLTSPGVGDSGSSLANFTPLSSMAASLSSVSPLSHRAFYFFGNFLMLAPLVVLIKVIWKKTPLWALPVIGLGASLTIEVLQYNFLPGRAADIDDVILNAFGTACATLVVAALERRGLLPTGKRGASASPLQDE